MLNKNRVLRLIEKSSITTLCLLMHAYPIRKSQYFYIFHAEIICKFMKERNNNSPQKKKLIKEFVYAFIFKSDLQKHLAQ
jgi:hypothetical protein